MTNEIKKLDFKKDGILHSILWVLIWMGLAAVCCAVIYFLMGPQRALEFVGGYLIEFSLSMDNLFVFISIFTTFKIAEHAQHRTLGYGILGAIILRFIFIFLGVQIVSMFEWVLYIFGVLLLWNAYKMIKDDKDEDPSEGKFIKFISGVMPMTKDFVGEKFFVRDENHKLLATPLFAVLCLIEFSDIIFAIDSVPAIFSVSTNVIVVYFSNIFAILGLRQLYFVLRALHERFVLVKYGVAAILAFTGIKLLGLIWGLEISIPVSIGIIAGVLILSILLSILLTSKKGAGSEEGGHEGKDKEN